MKPNTKQIHMFDLDGCLWNIDSKVWVIDKEKSNVPIIKIDKFEISKIQSGFYVKDGVKIEYNEKEYWISEYTYRKIRKKRKIEPERLGLSWIEFYDDRYINNNHVELLFNNLRHLQNQDVAICLLTARAYRERHEELLNKLRVEMKELGLEIWKIYFVGDRMYQKHNSEISLKKTYTLLEHMVGIKIEDGAFVSIKQDWFSDVNFYDDEFENIDYANDLQMLFDRICRHTDDETFKYVLQAVKSFDLQLTTNLISNNSINRFKKTIVKLREPITYSLTESHVKKYKGFDK